MELKIKSGKTELKIDIKNIFDWGKDCRSSCGGRHDLHRHINIRPVVTNCEDMWRIKNFKKQDNTKILHFYPVEDANDYVGYDNFQILVSCKCGDNEEKKKATEEIVRLTREIVEEVKRIAKGERPPHDPNFEPPPNRLDLRI